MSRNLSEIRKEHFFQAQRNSHLQTYKDKATLLSEINALQERLDAVEKCVRYQAIVEVDGTNEQVKVKCLLLDHVLAAMGYDVKARSLKQEQGSD